MALNRAQHSLREKDSTDVTHQLACEIVRISLVGGMMAGILYPIEIAMHQLQVNRNNKTAATFNPPKSFSQHLHSTMTYAMARSIARGYAISAQGAMIKCSVISQRDKLTDLTLLTEIKGENAEARRRSSHSVATSLVSAGISSAMLSLLDTGLTQYHSNLKAWNFQKTYKQANNDTYVLPKASQRYDHYNLWKAGIFSRYMKNSMKISSLLFTPVVDTIFKQANVPTAFQYLSPLLVSTITGFLSNAADVIYKNQIVNIDPQTLKTPTARDVIKNLYRTQGISSFKSGALMSIFNLMMVNLMINPVEKVANNVLGTIKKETQSSLRPPCGFFQRKSLPTVALKDSQSRQIVANQASSPKPK